MRDFNLNRVAPLAALSCVLLTGCGGEGPKEALEKYLQAVKDRDITAITEMVNWAGEKTPHYRPTRLAYVRSLIITERDHEYRIAKGDPMIQSDLFETAPDMLDRLDKMVIKKETDDYAEIDCYLDEEQGKSSREEVEMEKVDGVWKIKHSRTRGYQVVSEPGYDEQTPFCTGQTLAHWAAKGNAAAQNALSKMQNSGGRGGGSPREAVEALLKAMANFDPGGVYDVVLISDGENVSRESFANTIKCNVKSATISERWRKIGMAYRVDDVDEDGDSASVKIKGGEADLILMTARKNDRWFISDMSAFETQEETKE